MIYLDASVVIDLLQESAPRHAAVERFFATHDPADIVTSDLIYTAVLVQPILQGNQAFGERVLAKLRRLPMDENVCRRAAALRASLRLKTPDALHVATALVHECAEFWTSDARLRRLGSIEGVQIREP